MVHLRRNNPSVQIELEQMESKKLSEAMHMGIKRKALDEDGSTKLYSSSTQNQTLLQCITRRTTEWPTNSH